MSGAVSQNSASGLKLQASQAWDQDPWVSRVLLASVFLVGACTLIYELLIGSVSSYLLGDSITQFSLTMGLSMAAMGVGTYVSRLIHSHELRWFIAIEIALGLAGGLCVPALFLAYGVPHLFSVAMVSALGIIGVLIGIEIPLLTRLLGRSTALKANISNVLSLDYLGALAATLCFPFFLLPHLGLIRSGILAGAVNVAVGHVNLHLFGTELPKAWRRGMRRRIFAIYVLLIAVFVGADALLAGWESWVFQDPVIYSKQSRYQKIALTQDRNDVRLFLDGHLQFSSVDEHRYHESLVHVPMARAVHVRDVLVLGGGDGLAVRELLTHTQIESIVVVDLDPEVTALARRLPILRKQNQGALEHPKVRVLHQDAMAYLGDTPKLYDLIVADLPDPNSASLARLYSREFYLRAFSRLTPAGVMVTQATSPFFARNAFWTVVATMQEALDASFKPIFVGDAAAEAKTNPKAKAKVQAYHVHVPSMGEWGFVMAGRARPQNMAHWELSAPHARFLSKKVLPGLFVFPEDMGPPAARMDASTLNDPVVLQHYIKGWKSWF